MCVPGFASRASNSIVYSVLCVCGTNSNRNKLGLGLGLGLGLWLGLARGIMKCFLLGCAHIVDALKVTLSLLDIVMLL